MRLYHAQKTFYISKTERDLAVYMDDIFHPSLLLYHAIIIYTCHRRRHHFDAFIFSIYRFAFVSKGWAVYLWAFTLIGISTASIMLFSYIYFAFLSHIL